MIDPGPELAVTASYSMPLGAIRNIATNVERRDGTQHARLQYRRTRGASDLGLDYRLGADIGDDAGGVDARLSYQAAVGAADLELERRDGEAAMRAGVNGSVALIDGHLEATRRIGQAFGLVDMPGFPGVRVYVDNHEAGRTGEDGRLLLPGLRPYEANRIRLEVEDLPLDARVAAAETVAVPFGRSGMTVDLAAERRRQATVLLVAASGRPLPSGLVLRSPDGATTATVGREGFALLDGLADLPRRVNGELAGVAYGCELPPPPAGEPLPDLGKIPCGG